MTVAERNFEGVSRRTLLTGGLAGGFLLAFHLPARPLPVNEPVQPPDDAAGKFAPNAFIRIDRSGTTTLVMPQVEMGQGVYTSISMILAEELDADFSRVALEHAPPSDKLYGNPMFGIQATGNSNSIRAWWPHLRTAGASARAMLVQAAAQQWQVDPASCTTANSEVMHKRQRAQAFLWRAGARGEQRGAAKGCPAEGPEGFRADRQAAEAARHPRQGQRQGRLRHRCDTAQHEVRYAEGLSGIRRQGRQGRRQRRQENPGRAQDRGARRSGRRGRRSHVGGQEGPRCAGDRLGRRPECADVNSNDIWRDLRAASEKDGAVAKTVGDIAKELVHR